MIEFIQETWSDGWMGKCILALILLCVAFFAFLLWMLVYLACDSWFRPLYVGAAEIVARQHRPAYTTTHIQHVGKTSIPITTHHPESWTVELKMKDGRADSVSCSEEEYMKADNGKPAAIRYKVGRLSGSIYITEALWK